MHVHLAVVLPGPRGPEVKKRPAADTTDDGGVSPEHAKPIGHCIHAPPYVARYDPEGHATEAVIDGVGVA